MYDTSVIGCTRQWHIPVAACNNFCLLLQIHSSLSLSLHSLLLLERCRNHDATPFLSVGCLPPGGMDAEVHLMDVVADCHKLITSFMQTKVITTYN